MRLQTILKENEVAKVTDYCKINHLAVSAFIRSAICKKLDEEEIKSKWKSRKKTSQTG
jgi:hypothetical protein